MFSGFQMVFWFELLTWQKRLRALQFEDPGAVFELIAGMEFGVVAVAGLPHFPEDLEPALAEAAQRAGMGFAAGAKGLVIDRGPRRALPARGWPTDGRRHASDLLQWRRRATLWICPD